jgi:predicted ester cyclase
MKRPTLPLYTLAILMIGGAITLPAHARKASATAAHKERVRQLFEEVFNQGKVDTADQFISSDAVDHQMPPGMPQGVAGFKVIVTNMRTAFPDLHVTVDDTIAEGDKVVVRSTLHGTHTGELRMGPESVIPPTQKPVTITAIDIIRFSGDKMVEHWGNSDDLGMMQQLGLLSATSPAAPPAPAR